MRTVFDGILGLPRLDLRSVTTQTLPAMDGDEIRQRLNDALQAIKAGDRARGQELLLQVVETDPHNEAAWLWLAGVVDTREDKLIALENVLVINPANGRARALLEAQRRGLGLPAEPAAPMAAPVASPPRPPSPAAANAEIERRDEAAAGKAEDPVQSRAGRRPPSKARAAPSEAIREDALLLASGTVAITAEHAESVAEDDPYQCAYCGRGTNPDAARCPHCGRGLFVPRGWRQDGYQYSMLFIGGFQLQLALVQVVLAFLATNYPQALDIVPFREAFSTNLFWVAGLRAIAWAWLLVLMLGDSETVYPAGALVCAADLAWAGAGYWYHLVSPPLAAVNAGMAALIGLICASAIVSRMQSAVRLRVVFDKNVQGPLMFHQHGMHHARQGRWALAVLHLRRAIALKPDAPGYYKDLGRALVKLGRNKQAVSVFRSGAEMVPDDREFQRLIESVRARARMS